MAMQPTSELSRKTLILLLILYGLSIVTSVIFLSHIIPTAKPLMTSTRPTSHPAVVYFYNQTTNATNITDGFIKLYDVRTGQKVEVLRIPNARINEAQVSPDGQWVLFLTGGGRYGPYQLQRVRINGQQHETLYTFPPTNYSGSYSSSVDDFPISVEWSFDQKSVLISMNINNIENIISSLDITTGVLRALLHIGSSDYSYRALKWLDKTHVYIIALGVTVGNFRFLPRSFT